MPGFAYTLLITLATLTAPDAPPVRYTYSHMQMGMTFEITLYAAEEAAANRAAKAAFDRVDQLNAILSDYDPNSELSRLSDTAGMGQAIKVSESLWFPLARAQELSEKSDGAFDVTVGPLVRLWRRARRQKELPDPQRIAAARAAVGFRHLKLDPKERTATLTEPDMRLDLGGIGGGYAVDQALVVLREHGIRRAMVNASGDIGVLDPPPGAAGWKIGIAPLDKPDGPPSRYLMLANAAVTTSGDAFQAVEIDGQRYSHIVDSKTGIGLLGRSSATVVARDCITADSYATAVLVLGGQRGLKLIEDTPGAAVLIMQNINGQLTTSESSRLKQYTAD